MYFLAFESSCDDTSLALFSDRELVCMKTYSQLTEHIETQGVVPECAARLHAENIFPLLDELLAESGVLLSQISFIACTVEPGLAPSLLVTKSVAKVLSETLSIPFVPVHHIEGHIFALLLGRGIEEVHFPVMVMTVSGGHNELYLWSSLWDLERIAHTRDDSAGEAFDKVAKMMGLPFPWGAHIARYAQTYRETLGGAIEAPIFPLPRFQREDRYGYFSFSGLKSAVKRYIDAHIWEHGALSESDIARIAYHFEEIVTTYLLKSIDTMLGDYPQVSTVALCGGVSANDHLKEILSEYAQKNQLLFLAPKSRLFSLDNAAMIGMRAYYVWQDKITNA